MARVLQRFKWMCWVKKGNEESNRKAKREKMADARDGLIQRLRGRAGEQMCRREKTRWHKKVTGGGSHQNANVIWDIYRRVLMQFKTGSLSCSPSPRPCWALINQPLNADVTWIVLHTSVIRLYSISGVGTRQQLKHLWRCYLIMVSPEETWI